ncbi:nuclear protein 2-like [Tamandua tetradactyla]|uniref:nuclear protein 2-like n=1 Tax=Tamandua tetradactyla TaxID=48850 RepID=UPI0040543D6C
MDGGASPAPLHAQGRALPLPRETRSWVGKEEELYDCLDYYYLRDFPTCGAGRSKGRTRHERKLRTNRPVPGGHERQDRSEATERPAQAPAPAAAPAAHSPLLRAGYPKNLIKVFSLTSTVTVVLS